MKCELRSFKFDRDERIKAKHGCYFKIVKKERCVKYSVLHSSRLNVMRHACKKFEEMLYENKDKQFNSGLFTACFSQWFQLLVSTSVNEFEKSLAKFENVFISDFNIMLEQFKNSTGLEGEIIKLNSKPVGTLLIEPLSNLPTDEAENQKPSGVLKAGEARVVNLSLKTGNVKLEFETPPTAEDLEYLASYLKYQLL